MPKFIFHKDNGEGSDILSVIVTEKQYSFSVLEYFFAIIEQVEKCIIDVDYLCIYKNWSYEDRFKQVHKLDEVNVDLFFQFADETSKLEFGKYFIVYGS